MEESILTTTKKLLMLGEDDTSFETDAIVHINTFLRRLNQLGVGSRTFRVRTKADTYADFLGPNQETFDQVKDYIYIRCKLLFDPPTNGSQIKALEDTYHEIEWLLCADAESPLLKEELSLT